jgi:UPF0176 protein
MAPITNLSAYQFTPLDDLGALREQLLTAALAQQLKGTVLLSREGINLFVAGRSSGIQIFLEELRRVPGLETLTPKLSHSAQQPFGRMQVKIKKEIITFGLPDIDPARRPARKLSPEILKRWLDEGRRIILLDTRNEYEVKLGTFRGAVDPGIKRFRDFPAAAARFTDSIKSSTVVTFCTGGIRCEKAAPFLEQQGWSDVYQLDGGILKYFEACGGAHFEGECFVFDERVGVDAALRETGSTLCNHCQLPLTAAEQRDPRYVADKSCPHCFIPTIVEAIPVETRAE